MQMSVPKGRYRTMGVTPQILSRPITDRLARYIQQKLTDRASKENWRAYLLRRIAEYLRQPPELRPIGMSAWTVRASNSSYLLLLLQLMLMLLYHTGCTFQRNMLLLIPCCPRLVNRNMICIGSLLGTRSCGISITSMESFSEMQSTCGCQSNTRCALH